MSPLRWRTGAAGRIAMASLPIMRMNWRRRRANSLRSMGSMQPLLGRIDLPAKRQKFFEDDLGRDPDELDQLGISLLVGFIRFRVIAGRPRDFREIPHDFSDIAVQCFEIGNMSGSEAVEKSRAPQCQRIGTAIERRFVVR